MRGARAVADKDLSLWIFVTRRLPDVHLRLEGAECGEFRHEGQRSVPRGDVETCA